MVGVVQKIFLKVILCRLRYGKLIVQHLSHTSTHSFALPHTELNQSHGKIFDLQTELAANQAGLRLLKDSFVKKRMCDVTSQVTLYHTIPLASASSVPQSADKAPPRGPDITVTSSVPTPVTLRQPSTHTLSSRLSTASSGSNTNLCMLQ